MRHIAIRLAMAVTSFALTLLLPHRIATADTEKPKVVLTPANADLVVGPRMNAAGRDLRGCKFFTQDLRGANFDGCNLYGCHIVDCLLRGASFRNAIFVGSVVDFGDDGNSEIPGTYLFHILNTALCVCSFLATIKGQHISVIWNIYF